jgi:Uma2 family endonuclease
MPAAAVLTSEQFLSLPVEFDQNGNEVKDELIGGEVVLVSFASELHNLVKIKVLESLIPFILANLQLGLKVTAEMAYIVSEHDTYIPDASVIHKNRLKPLEEKYIKGGPEIAVEVVSPSDSVTHLNAKIDAYLQSGSKTVWVVFPDTRSVMVYTNDAVRKLKGDQPIEDPLLPGFSVPISQFFDLT